MFARPPALSLVVGLLAISASCQDVLITINLYDNSTVDPFSTQSSQLTLFPKSSGSKNSDCSSTSIGLNDWPMTDKGQYKVWVDAGSVEDGCQLMLYDAPESDDDWKDNSDKYCQGLKWIFTGKNSIAYAELDNKFGVAYCCDDACDKQPSAWTRDVHDTSERSELPGADKDVASLERRKDCTFQKSGDSITTYGDQKKFGDKKSCASDMDSTACEQSFTYTTSSTVSAYSGSSFTAGISIGGSIFSEFLSAIGLDFSYTSETSTETTNTTEWSISQTMGPSPGTTAYATFQPKMICSQGDFVGDCDGADGLGDWKCANYFTQDSSGTNIQPEGVWRMVTVY